MKLQCWNCGAPLDDVPRPISRHATCGACFNELHCCRLCRHYDPKRTMQCFEDRADPPLQKENANFCDFFAPSAHAFEPKTTNRSDTAKDALDALFDSPLEEAQDTLEDSIKGMADEATPGPLTPEEEAKRKLDDLFKS